MVENNSNNDEDKKDLGKMLVANFNQDGACFAVGTENGFKIFNSSPFRDNFERNLEGGIGIVEMLNRCNILALVGGGKSPKYATNKVIIWDDHQSKVVSELRFTTYVKNVKLKKDKLIVVCDHKIYIFNLLNFQNIDTIDTSENIKGLIAISTDSKSSVLAHPDNKQGNVRVKFFDREFSQQICAHESTIAAIALNCDGTLLATASDKGTLIRIFDTQTGKMLQEVRRGSEKAVIYSISFNPSSTLLACSSDRGTIHIFSLAGALKKLREGGELK
jgi:WD40 repeat protein